MANKQKSTETLNRFVESRLLAPQTEKVARHLLKDGEITGVLAAALYGVRHLPARIRELRELGASGLTIGSHSKVAPNGQRYVSYRLGVETPVPASSRKRKS